MKNSKSDLLNYNAAFCYQLFHSNIIDLERTFLLNVSDFRPHSD